MEIGKCGMPCGLCPMYHITTSGRCTGCSKERGCGIISCCERKKAKICSECNESPCIKITKMKEFPSFHTDRVWERNLAEIQKIGYDEWIKDYSRKMELIQVALEKYNAGRSKNFICHTFIDQDLSVLEHIMKEAENITSEDKKERATQFKNLVKRLEE